MGRAPKKSLIKDGAEINAGIAEIDKEVTITKGVKIVGDKSREMTKEELDRANRVAPEKSKELPEEDEPII